MSVGLEEKLQTNKQTNTTEFTAIHANMVSNALIKTH